MGATYLELVRKVDKLPIHMDWQTLDIYCEYLLNDDSKYVNYSNLSNMRMNSSQKHQQMENFLLMTKAGLYITQVA